MSKDKPKLEFQQLIYKLKTKGIKFELTDEKQAIDSLKNKNYYYRIASYRKNFDKNEFGQYENLDFAVLQDLASIDTYVREYLLSLSLDFEHLAKTYLMKEITYNTIENGYSILDEFKEKNHKGYHSTLKYFNTNSYLKDMYKKRDKISVWVFLEITTFGTFNSFLEFYVSKYKDSDNGIIRISQYSKYIKNIRNTCAHNNVFLINLYNYQSNYIRRPSPLSKSFCNELEIDVTNANYNKIHDMLVLFKLHKTMASESLNKRRYYDGKKVIERINKHNSYYETNSNDLQKTFTLLNVLVDYLNNDV